MRTIIIIITCIFLLSCSKKASTEQNSSSVLSEVSDSSFINSPLHPDLLKAWDMYRESGMDNIIDTTICYFVEFCRNPKDSMALISFNECGKKYIGYKGMTNIDGYYIAVIDSGNIGKNLYNSKLLMQKDISEFKCFKSKFINGKVVGGYGFVVGMDFIRGLGFTIKNNRIDFEGTDFTRKLE